MESFFVPPSSLPGGEQWGQACAALRMDAEATEKAIESTRLLRESLGCDSSPVGGFVQVLFLMVVYGAILFFVRRPLAQF